MRASTHVWSLSLMIAAASGAFAQTGTQPIATSKMSPEAWMAEENTRFAQCLKDWDAKTHMTKQEWERTCRRVTDERLKYLRESGDIPPAARRPQTGSK
jgi:hypothetical protein